MGVKLVLLAYSLRTSARRSLEYLVLIIHKEILLSPGLPCGEGPNLVCHGDVVTRLAGIMSHAVLCNNGLGQLMETGEFYESPREARPRCVFKVNIIISSTSS